MVVKKKLSISILFLVVTLFLLMFITAQGLEIGGNLDSSGDNEVSFDLPPPPINVTTGSQTFNKSDIWVTNEGLMDNIPDLYPTLAGEYLELDGGNFGFTNNFLSYTEPNFDFNAVLLNSTIEQFTRSIEYNASMITTTAGTLDGGNLQSILVAGDNDWYNVSENSGATPNLEIIINFTGITNFNSVQFDVRYDDGGGHEIAIGIFDCSGGYEEEYLPNIADSSGMMSRSLRNVLDPAEHICGGADKNVSIRFRHLNIGNPNHDFFIDDIKLIQGAPVSSPVEVDPLSLHSSGDVSPSGNFDWAGFNLTNMGTLIVNFLGNITNRITKIWATDLDVNGTIQANNINVSETFGVLSPYVNDGSWDCNVGIGNLCIWKDDESYLYFIGPKVEFDGDANEFVFYGDVDADKYVAGNLELRSTGLTTSAGDLILSSAGDIRINPKIFSPEGSLQFNDNVNISGNVTILGNYISNGTAIFSLQDLNNTGSAGNLSFNQSFTDDLYVNVAGDTMTGSLTLNDENVTIQNNNAMNKVYFDTDGSFVVEG